jgi:hypothetical protein
VFDQALAIYLSNRSVGTIQSRLNRASIGDPFSSLQATLTLPID